MRPLNSFNQALEIKPDSIEARYNRSQLFIETGQYTDAWTGFNQVLDRDPDYSAAWFGLGLALAGLNRHQEALNSYNRSVPYTFFLAKVESSRFTLWSDSKSKSSLGGFDGLSSSVLEFSRPSKSSSGFELPRSSNSEDAVPYARNVPQFGSREKAQDNQLDEAKVSFAMAKSYMALRKLPEALESLMWAIQIKPDFPDAVDLKKKVEQLLQKENSTEDAPKREGQSAESANSESLTNIAPPSQVDMAPIFSFAS